MSKLNLVNLTRDELSKEEAQRVQGGLLCYCPCTCSCECPPRETVAFRKDEQIVIRMEDRAWYEVN